VSVNLLKEKIVQHIISEGPISFECFMEMALYCRELGYYVKGSAPIGRRGDYYTSPHLHKIFGFMLAKQVKETWHVMGRPNVFQVLELGAGMGYLAKDILEYLKGEREKDREARTLFDHLQYTIVELNPSARTQQQQMCSEFGERVQWSPDLEGIPPITGCVLSNELLDAFPVRLVEMGDTLMEVYVSVKDTQTLNRSGEENGVEECNSEEFSDEDNFIEVRMPCSEEIEDYFEEFGVTLPRGYRTEVNLKIRDWIKQICSKLSTGFILTIDYGYPAWEYYSEERSAGTLLCYHRHQTSENPYLHIGEQDITAHVNFSSLKRWGDALGLKTVGYCPQGIYLVSLGIDGVINELYRDFPDPFGIAQIKGLVLPQGMGESHKVLMQYKGKGEPKLDGFALRNQTWKL
jgi:SAM-dependent MidA family methyltransferase